MFTHFQPIYYFSLGGVKSINILYNFIFLHVNNNSFEKNNHVMSSCQIFIAMKCRQKLNDSFLQISYFALYKKVLKGRLNFLTQEKYMLFGRTFDCTDNSVHQTLLHVNL